MYDLPLSFSSFCWLECGPWTMGTKISERWKHNKIKGSRAPGSFAKQNHQKRLAFWDGGREIYFHLCSYKILLFGVSSIHSLSLFQDDISRYLKNIIRIYFFPLQRHIFLNQRTNIKLWMFHHELNFFLGKLIPREKCEHQQGDAIFFPNSIFSFLPRKQGQDHRGLFEQKTFCSWYISQLARSRFSAHLPLNTMTFLGGIWLSNRNWG